MLTSYCPAIGELPHTEDVERAAIASFVQLIKSARLNWDDYVDKVNIHQCNRVEQDVACKSLCYCNQLILTY